MRLGILTSHPIQYQAPWFRALAKEVDLEVFFAHRQTAAEQGRAGFGVAFEWDVDLLSGYEHRFLKNVSRNPGVNHFAGCDTPQLREVIRAGKFDAFIVSGWVCKLQSEANGEGAFVVRYKPKLLLDEFPNPSPQRISERRMVLEWMILV